MKINKIIVGTTIIGIGSLVASIAFGAESYTGIQLQTDLSDTPASTSLNLDVKAHGTHNDEKDSVNARADVNTDVNVGVENEDGPNQKDHESVQEKDDNENAQGEHGDSQKDSEESDMGDAHRSAISLFVKNLLAVADRESDIGAEIRAIAKAQGDKEDETATALAKVENRSSFKTFFFGTDYENIGVLRAEMATTANQIEALKKLADKATSISDKATLQAQIQLLEHTQVTTDAFIKANESKFSLFGWLFKK